MPSILNATTTSGLVTSADNSGSLQLQTNNGTTAVTIDTSQNVGIGLTSPTSKLTIRTADGDGVAIQNAGGTGYRWAVNADNSFSCVNTGVAERMRITSGGLVGIGTNSPSSLLQVAGSSLFQDQMQIFNNPTSSAQGILFRNTFNVGASIFSMGAATTNGIIAFVGGNGTQGGINGNGAGISYTSASDYRLKENIAPMTGALAKVGQLKPCTYTWKSDGSAGQGFIAHELQAVVPEAVFGEKDAVDEDGNIKPQSVDTSFLVATLTAAIQELKTELDTVKAELNTLKNPPVEGTE